MKREPVKADLVGANAASCTNTEFVLRANGAEISAAARDAMLAKCAAGEYVELDLELLAYEQKPSASNRNFVRFRDGAMLAMGRSGVGTPFLRDHADYSAMARGGTITASQTEKRGEGDYAIRQTVKLTAPWAVELALRGLLSTVSIGWNPNGATLCTVCNANFYRCSHMPGARYSARTDEGGTTYVADPAGALVCERMFTSAELTETSAVNVPAVPTAHIEAIRAALSAHNDPDPQEHENHMNPKLAAILCLAATASEPEVITAVEKLKNEGAADRAELAIVKAELALANTELGVVRADKKKSDENTFIAAGIARGALAAGGSDEKMLRDLYQLAPDRAALRLAERPDGSVTPVGQPRASAGAAPPEPTEKLGNASEVIAKSGGRLASVRKNLLSMGYPPAEADKLIGRHIGGVKEA